MIHKTAISFLFLLLTGGTASAQEFRNLDFSQTCDSSKSGLCHWDVSWTANELIRFDLVDNRHTLCMVGKDESAVGFVEQAVAIPAGKGLQILSLSGEVKCEDLTGKGAGLNIGLYDEAEKLIAFRDMGGFYSIDWITGTRDWKKYTISIVCPSETTTIRIGAILYGKGDAWFSDFTVNMEPIAGRKPSKLAQRYIDAVCDTILLHSVVRDSLPMSALKETALRIAGPAKSYSDCYLAVDYLVQALRSFGDEHSFFMSAAEVKNWESAGSQVSKIGFPSYRIISGCGYILVPPFHGGNPEQIKAYADTLQHAIELLSKSAIKGWIVDLRLNTGGNMEPMIAGLGPLFSDDKLGSLIDVNGKTDSWHYRDGNYFWDNSEGWSVDHPIRLTEHLPIAVLTSHQTGSSGEIVAMSFVGNATTQLFGQPTWGLTTGNGSFGLKDGSQLFLASTIMTDRNGKRYPAGIVPDTIVEEDPKTDYDDVLDAAIKWIAK